MAPDGESVCDVGLKAEDHAALSEQAITTILGVNTLKVVENIFEHNDGAVFGRSRPAEEE